MENEVFILWTNSNKTTSEKMVFMYAHNAVLEGWWKNVTLIIWGPTARLVGKNKRIQKKILQMKKDGVTISACKACADELKVSNKIEKLGVELIYWGEPLTELIKNGKKLIAI